ncbi:tyrosine-protein phosphatase [Pinibacter soli]|uniref:Tyrosine-protein phosphatase n=1 Tax=Pinibacter soli TaxID=3044211 RepID=A0ABT6RF87_9BACT|nr:tyrosine-protein phosphatase [Pinibacter soli]MDI3321237.1 tyrosine-protein phosphatase [Pinibacter soli]
MKRISFLSLIIFPLLTFAQIADSSKREVKLQGAINFRDIGGYTTNDGKHVKWGKLYRSAALNKLSEQDLQTLAKLSISYDLDFRGPYEVATAPDRIPTTTRRISLPAGSETIGDSASMRKMMQANSLTEFYSDLTPFTARYKPMFDQMFVVAPDSALLFHCSAGKDRTGIAAALILYALGVNEETIMADYTATNYYRRSENEKAMQMMTAAYKMPEERAKKMMAADPAYLQATFNSIKTTYGSIDNYLAKEMGLTKSKLKKLQSMYVE